jgi:hypothetical protein
MHTASRTLCAHIGWGSLFTCLVLTTGCQPVREDRTITWSGSGNSVGFQHGQDGVFVADRQGGGLTKIFQPDADVLATSPPLWHPAGGRLIFTTARPAQRDTPVPALVRGEPDPAGRVFVQQPVVYTCWLREEARDGQAPEPEPLFEAACDHVGYVAANLAVRWHPHGDRILYVKQVGPGRHGVFEYDLTARTSRPAFPHTAEALLFDWAPDGEHLVCVLGSSPGDPATDGIWVGRPGAGDWWHVPDSAALAEGQLPSLLEQLRATRPAWTSDGARFAFLSSLPKQGGERTGWYFLCLATPARREVTVAAAAGEPFRDLHWSPDGSRLGVVQGGEAGALRLLEEGGELSEPINRHPVRQFAGWRGDGRHLAYVVADPAVPAAGDSWTFLLVPDSLARDAVYLADGRGTEPGREVFSGMRVTFPNWSPTDDRLSLWVTFSPTYRSAVSEALLYFNLGLRRGDPAATLDTSTGRLGWMAVDANEKAQVGHYYLLKRDYAEAWRWYEQAERGQLPARPEGAADLAHLADILGTRDPAFFEYYCLTKLGRPEEAREKLARFQRTYLRLPDKEQQPWLDETRVGERSVREWLEGMMDPDTLTGAVLRDLYMAEAFLSVDAAEDGEDFFRRAVDTAPSDSARLGSALVLAQLLLVQKKHQAYADLATRTIAPLLVRAERGASLQKLWEHPTPRAMQEVSAVYLGGLTLLPLFAPDFVAGLPDDQLRALAPRWQALHAAAEDDFSRLAADLVLQAVYQRLGLEQERREVAARLEKESPAARDVPWGGDVRHAIEQIRTQGIIPLPVR